MIKCIIYTRVSSEDQVKGYSLQNQKKVCYEIAGQYGLQNHEIKYLEEPGISAETIETRPQLKYALKIIEGGRIRFAIALDQDRWTRSVADWTGLFTGLFRRFNVRILTAQGEIDLTKRDHRLFSNIKGSISQWHKEYIIEKCQEGIKQSIDDGFWFSGRPPRGYLHDRQNTIETVKGRKRFALIRDKSLQDDILYIFSTAENRGARAVAAALGKGWTDDKVARIRKNPLFAGLMYNTQGELIKCKQVVKPYITAGRYFEISQFAKTRRPPHYSQEVKYLLTPILRCGYCGCTWQTKKNITGNRKAYWLGYVCNGKKRGRSFCRSKGHAMATLDNLVIAAILTLAGDKAKLKLGYDLYIESHADESGLKRQALLKEAKVLALKKNRLVQAIEAGTITPADVGDRVKEINYRLEAIQIELDSIHQAEAIPDLDTVFEALMGFADWPVLMKRKFLAGFISEIVVWKKKLIINYTFLPEAAINIPEPRRGPKPLKIY